VLRGSDGMRKQMHVPPRRRAQQQCLPTSLPACRCPLASRLRCRNPRPQLPASSRSSLRSPPHNPPRRRSCDRHPSDDAYEAATTRKRLAATTRAVAAPAGGSSSVAIAQMAPLLAPAQLLLRMRPPLNRAFWPRWPSWTNSSVNNSTTRRCAVREDVASDEQALPQRMGRRVVRLCATWWNTPQRNKTEGAEGQENSERREND
jgi:hypothetical protein